MMCEREAADTFVQQPVYNVAGGSMLNSRRQFLATSLALAAAGYRSEAQTPGEPPPGSPPAFGTGPLVGPEVSPATFAEAEKLVQIQMSEGDRALAASSWRQNLASLYELRTG